MQQKLDQDDVKYYHENSQHTSAYENLPVRGLGRHDWKYEFLRSRWRWKDQKCVRSVAGLTGLKNVTLGLGLTLLIRDLMKPKRQAHV